MVATVQSTETLKELLQEAQTAEEAARAAQSNLDSVLDRLNGARSGVAAPRSRSASPTEVEAPAGPPRRGRKKSVKKKGPKSAAGAPKKRGRPKGTSAGAPKKSTGRRSQNEHSLKKAIWLALDREKWPMLTLPAEADKDLNVGEIYEVIVHDKLWKSKKGDKFTGMISTEIQKLRKEGKVARGDNMRYYVVEGAAFDGPALDEDGKPKE